MELVTKSRSRRTSAGNSEGTTFLCKHYHNSPLGDALAFIHELLSPAAVNPPKLHFSSESGDLNRIIQRTERSVIAQFVHKEYETCIVKVAAATRWAPDINAEIEFLRHLQEPSADRPLSIPMLLYSSPDPTHPEIAIHPYGTSFHLEAFRSTKDARACLMDILHALAWVHARGLVHGDVRADNIILVQPKLEDRVATGREIRAVLIDLDRAAEIGVTTVFQVDTFVALKTSSVVSLAKLLHRPQTFRWRTKTCYRQIPTPATVLTTTLTNHVHRTITTRL